MKQLIALFAALVVSTVGAQTVQTTPNLITSGTSHTWYGVTTGAVASDYMGGTSAPRYDPATNTIYFSYGSGSPGQTMMINQALANASAGVKINGYTYSYDVRNMNGDDRQPGVDTFTVSQLLRGPANSVLLSSNQYHNIKFEWKTVTGSKTAITPYNIADTTYMQFGVSGVDSGFWGGYFGPQIRNVNMKLNYTVDPCVTNPAYSPTCANYNTVTTSDNLLSGTTGAQAYAINQALALAGANTTIHGFDYGYDYRAAGRSCAVWDIFGLCITGFNYSSAGVTTTLTNSTGVVGHTETNMHAGGNNGVSGAYSKSLRLGASVPMSTLGTFSMTSTTSGNAAITNMYSRAVYTPDPCTSDPLSSTSCAGYAQAYQDQQCSMNPLYATVCAGYQAAYLTQQCTANTLYNASCPGYAQAYFTQQCSSNPLYDSQCPGYTVAYHDQQCNLNPLYATDCTGYQAAYLTQQCNISQLHSTQCPGYQVAYHDQQCSISALYMSDCPGYQAAYFSQQCTANTLYDSLCPGYQVAYKAQQCSISALYATDCPGYQAAYHDSQCAANPLYMSDCPGYQAAYLTQQCNISQLYSTQCPNYQTAYFAQQCQLNGLYDRTCPNYATAYAAKNILATPTVTPTTTSTVVIATESTATVTSNPAASAITDPVVSAAVATPTTTSATSPTSVTSVISAPAATTSAVAVAAANPVPAVVTPAAAEAKATEAKKTDNAVASIEKKAGSNRENARAAATERAKELANEAGKAATMEAQAATQGLVVGLMGYVPGFTSYQNSIVPDTMANAVARQYYKPTVDNKSAQRQLSGSNEVRWKEMVDSQYKQ
jgi:hypothetical protein